MRALIHVGRWAAVVLGSLVIVSVVGLQAAGAVNFFGDVCEGNGSSSTVCDPENDQNISGNDGIILQAASLVAAIAGAAAVVMIIIGGFSMVTAGGDAQKAGNAKKMITYAVVGLVVIVLARAIVGFIVTRVG